MKNIAEWEAQLDKLFKEAEMLFLQKNNIEKLIAETKPTAQQHFNDLLKEH